MIRVAPEGWPFIIAAWIAWSGVALLGWWGPALVGLPVALWVVAFFRDPVRDGPRGTDLLVAPADGKVVSVREIVEPDFHKDRVWRVSIFMNVFNVHVNRYPAGGVIHYRHYHPGRFINAAAEKASLENEQASVGLDTDRGKVLVRQIAGLIARRIVTDHDEGARVAQGDRMGIIRFGSRVDLFFPLTAQVRVAIGDTTKAGQTVVAAWT